MSLALHTARSRRALASAHLLLADGDTEGACNRAYYAMFDAAHAAVLAAAPDFNNATTKTHQGLIAALEQHLVAPRHLTEALGRALNQVERVRLLADYTAEDIDETRASWAVEYVREAPGSGLAFRLLRLVPWLPNVPPKSRASAGIPGRSDDELEPGVRPGRPKDFTRLLWRVPPPMAAPWRCPGTFGPPSSRQSPGTRPQFPLASLVPPPGAGDTPRGPERCLDFGGVTRASQVPGEPQCVHARLFDPGGTDLGTRPIRCSGVAFRRLENVGSRKAVISGLNHKACTLAHLSFAAAVARRDARLASGGGPTLAERD